MSGRPLCPRCRRPLVVCYCEHVTELQTRTRVLLLQHPRERDVPINTARIAQLCLPEATLRVGVDFEHDAVVQAALRDPERPAILLFPGPESHDLRTAPPAGDVTLVVLDGTWSQAAKLLKHNPTLATLPRYQLEPSLPSQYRIRKEPAEHCVATIEAIAEVLGVLERDPEKFQSMRRPFNAMVERQLDFATNVRGARTRYGRRDRVRKPRPLPDELLDPNASLLLVYGEANAWPYDALDAPPPEMVHWVALRIGTGESFEARAAPSGAVAPSIDRHAGLSREEILAGESSTSLLSRWEAFVEPHDVLCTWGDYALDVLESQGAQRRHRVCLRRAMSQFLGDKTGALEFMPARLEVDPPAPMFPGRSGHRLAAMQVVLSVLLKSARERDTPAAVTSPPA